LSDEVLLVDFENVHQVDLSLVRPSSRVLIFLGCNQKCIPVDLVTAAHSLGERVEWIRIEGNGANSLDFHIACHLGQMIERKTNSVCVVLSKDKGFDPLLKYLNRNGLKCRRIETLEHRKQEKPAVVDTPYVRVLSILRKMEKKSLPRRRKTLVTHITSLFQEGVSAQEVERVIDRLFADKHLAEENGEIAYRF